MTTIATILETVKGPEANGAKCLPSQAQVNYFMALANGKQVGENERAHLIEYLPNLDRRTMAALIQWMVGLPWKPRPVVTSQSPKHPIMEGCYAIIHPGDGVLRFYEVRKPTKGKWAGFVFLSQLSGENHIRIREQGEREIVYGEISKNPMDSLKRYGQHIGRCGHCRKQLTDSESRQIGIGPVCRKHLGVESC